MNDEEFVRSKWTSVACKNWYKGQGCAVEAWYIWLPCDWTSPTGHTANDPEMWVHAKAFTEARIVELDKLRSARSRLAAQDEDFEFVIALIDRDIEALSRGMG
jgi:hypothetical protein